MGGRHGGPHTHVTWTEEEDAILRANADKTASWPGWADLMPTHTTSAIRNRRKKLGISSRTARKLAPRALPASAGKSIPVTLPAEAGEWDGDQLAWLTEAVGLLGCTGHTLAECVAAIMAISNACRGETEGW